MIWWDQKVEWEWFKLDLLEDADCTLPEGLKAVAYIAGIIPKPDTTETENLVKWRKQMCRPSLPSLMNITPNVQARLDCFVCKGSVDSLLSHYAQADPIIHNLAQICLCTKNYMKEELRHYESHSWTPMAQRVCGGLGVDISDAQFSGMIILSMSMPSWDPVIGTLGGILDPKVVISWLNMEWSQRQGLTLKKKDSMSYFRPVGNHSKMRNYNRTGHPKARCWEKGEG